MFWGDPYHDQLVKQIESLIAAGQYQKAMDACSEVLDNNPDDGKILGLVRRINQKVQEENEEKIDQKMQELDPLWKDGKYDEIVKKLHELKKFSPTYQPLLNAIIRAEEKYRARLNISEKEQFQKIKSQFDELFKSGKLDEVIQIIQSLEADIYQDEKVLKYAKEMRAKLIDKHLEMKADFIKSDSIQEILSFLERIQSIDPRNKRLELLIQETKLRKVENLGMERAEKSFSSIEDIKTLIKLGKYEEAASAAADLAIYNPTSKGIQKLKKEADEKFSEQLDNEIIEQMKKSNEQDRGDYENNNEGFKRLF